MKRMNQDWACPECVWHAETELQLQPVHKAVGVELTDAAGQPAAEVDAVQSEAEIDPNREPLEHYHALPWLRWKMGQQPDFKGEVNVLEQVGLDRGYVLWFLPKFHYEINWAELYWANSKSFVRSKVDGKWGTMVKALWWSYGQNNAPLVFVASFYQESEGAHPFIPTRGPWLLRNVLSEVVQRVSSLFH